MIGVSGGLTETVAAHTLFMESLENLFLVKDGNRSVSGGSQSAPSFLTIRTSSDRLELWRQRPPWPASASGIWLHTVPRASPNGYSAGT